MEIPPAGKHFTATVRNHGIFATHNLGCYVCHTDEPAVFDCNRGYFEPCLKCQSAGYRTVRLSRFKQWLVGVLK